MHSCCSNLSGLLTQTPSLRNWGCSSPAGTTSTITCCLVHDQRCGPMAVIQAHCCRRMATSSPALTPQQVPRGIKRRKLAPSSGSSSPLIPNGVPVVLTGSEAEGTGRAPGCRMHVLNLRDQQKHIGPDSTGQQHVR